MDPVAQAVAANALSGVTTPTEFYRRTDHRQPAPLPTGADALAHRWIGVFRRRAAALSRLRRQASEAESEWNRIKDQTDHQLRVRLLEHREVLRRGGRPAEAALIPALAATREAAHRQLGLLAFPEQLMGALALHGGSLAEMATGEGKTLTAGIAAVLMAWNGRPCHVITVNDYLVERDAQWLGPLYRFCGLHAGFVTAPLSPEERQSAYACDITYTTSKEVVADFLRDALKLGNLRNPTRRLVQRLLQPRAESHDGLVMRGLHTAIVDEADSILIDEAVTPLIISAPRSNDSLKEVVRLAQSIAQPLEASVHYSVNHRHREIDLTQAGNELLDALCTELPGFWRAPDRRTEVIRQALVAREFYQPGRQYVVVDGKIVIVDEFTGRQMAQRSWRQGLHQAVEAKEGLNLTDPTETIARISFQRYFRSAQPPRPTPRPHSAHRRGAMGRRGGGGQGRACASSTRPDRHPQRRGQRTIGRTSRERGAELPVAQRGSAPRGSHRGGHGRRIRSHHHRHQHGGSWHRHPPGSGRCRARRTARHRHRTPRIGPCRPPALRAQCPPRRSRQRAGHFERRRRTAAQASSPTDPAADPAVARKPTPRGSAHGLDGDAGGPVDRPAEGRIPPGECLSDGHLDRRVPLLHRARSRLIPRPIAV
ncbi:MAG: hypothetical protein EBU81_09385, partial [Proteobacteria bacterium]|nr:hypothetical protein [Pseudomonadota bacterium]